MASVQQRWLDEIGGILETLNQGVIIDDDRRQVVFANSIFLEMIKMRSTDLVGRRITDLFPPEDVARLIEFIQRRETQGSARYEFYVPQAGGGRLPVRTHTQRFPPIQPKMRLTGGCECVMF